MTTSWTTETYPNIGCYDKKQADTLANNATSITLQQVLQLPIPLADKFKFCFDNCNFTNIQKQQLSLACAKITLPIYNKQYPNDNRISVCIETTERYYKGEATLEELKAARAARAAAGAAAWAAGAAAAAWAAWAARAAAWAADKTIELQLLNMLIEFTAEK